MYTPNPIDTTNISLPRELLNVAEILAENTHDVWAAQRIREGWTYGDARDDEKKKTPCLVPYSKLPESEKVFDRNTSQETLRVLYKMGYRLVKDE